MPACARLEGLILSSPPAGADPLRMKPINQFLRRLPPQKLGLGRVDSRRHRGRFLPGAKFSPILSWTVGPWSTPDCRQSVASAVEHAY